MEKRGNDVAFPAVYFVWVGLVLIPLLFRLQYSTVPVVPRVGRLAIVPLFGSHTRAPIGRTALRACASGSYPEVSPLDDSPSPRAGHIDRTRSHRRARANVPWDSPDAYRKAPPRTARARVHTLRMRSPRPARWPSIQLTRLRCRLPLLTTSACRARAQLKLQPTKPLHGSDWAGCDGVDRRPRRKLACAHRCSFSFAAFCSHHLGGTKDTMDSSASITSRRNVSL
jgi:hypothetical protein